jgi:hypothetical protein
MPQIDISTDSLTRLNTVAEKDYQGASLEQAWTDCSASLSGYPGMYALGPPQPGSAFGVYRPALLEQAVLEHVVHHHDGSTEVVPPGDAHGAGDEVSPARAAHAIRATVMDRRRTGRRPARRHRPRPLG